jgi:CBS domain-containing protein
MNTVEDILREKGAIVYTVAPTTMTFEAVEKMVKHNIGALLVIDGEGVKGIVTERDYLKRIAVRDRSMHTTPVAEIMTRELVSVTPATDIDRCMELMTGRRIRHLPVLEGDRVRGVVSIGDLVKAKLRDQDAHIRDLTTYIQGSPTASF